MMLAAATVGAALASTPMNRDTPGGLYLRSAGPGVTAPVPHEVAHRGEYFEAYSPNITTVYSQVFWTMMDEVPLDDEMVRPARQKAARR